MFTITKSRLITSGTIPFKHAWARLPWIGIERDFAIIDLAYLFAGLVPITQFRLVHCILQGVEHTDPTEWSNSHLLHWRQIHTGCSTNSQFFRGCSLFSFEWWFSHFIWGRLRNISFRTAPQHFILSNIQDLYRNGGYYICTYNGLFHEQLGHIMIYYNWYQTT